MDQHGFQTVTSTDHRAWLWVVSFLSLVYSFLCFGARLTGKWDILSYDDAILGGGYVFAIAHYGTMFKAIYSGLGASPLILTSEQIRTAADAYFSSRIFYFAALCLSKVSVLVFTRRIFSGDIYKEKVFFAIAYVFTAIYGLCGVLLSSAGCRPDRALALGINAVCNANVARWVVITILDVLTELMILALPVWFISKNQLKASKKRVVIFVFCFRLIVAAFSVATTFAYFHYLKGSALSVGAVGMVVWQEVLLGSSLISASIPCLRTFLWAFMSTGLMTVYGNTTSGGGSYGIDSQRTPNASALHSQNRDDIRPQAQSRVFQSRLRPDRHGYKVDIRSQQRSKTRQKSASRDEHAERGSVKSYGSEQFIIHQTTEFEIERS